MKNSTNQNDIESNSIDLTIENENQFNNDISDTNPLLPKSKQTIISGTSASPKLFSSIKSLQITTLLTLRTWIVLPIWTAIIMFVIIFSKFFSFKFHISYINDSLILHPIHDFRKYRFIQWTNGLEVTIISDKLSQVSSASLSVGVGANEDPWTFPGLAHFCEHMLFLGSSKYPKGDDYFKSVTENNGHFNAGTERENTNFFFDVHYRFWEPTLDIFAHFFIDPLFSKDKIIKEINSVNSEYEKNWILDNKKINQILSQESKPKKPFHKFSTGNYETWMGNGIDELYKQWLHFYQSNYSANKMKLVVYSNHDVQYLERWITTIFKQIPSSSHLKQEETIRNNFIFNYSRTPFLPPFYKSHLNSIILFDSIINNNEMNIVFIQPQLNTKSVFKANPYKYLQFILESKDTNSISSLLKSKQYITKLSIKNERNFKSWSDCIITLSLTKEGYYHTEEILRIWDNYFTFIKTEMVKKVYYDYWYNWSRLNFEYFSFDYNKWLKDISKIANKMQRIPKEFLWNEYHFISQWSDTTLRQIVKYLNTITISNSMIFLNRRNDYSNFTLGGYTEEVGTKYEKYYQTNYTVFSIAKRLKEADYSAYDFQNFNETVIEINDQRTKKLLMNIKECNDNCIKGIIENENKIPEKLWLMNQGKFEVYTQQIMTLQNNKIATAINLNTRGLRKGNYVFYTDWLELLLNKKLKKIKNDLKLYSNYLKLSTYIDNIEISYMAHRQEYEEISGNIVTVIADILDNKVGNNTFNSLIRDKELKLKKMEKQQPYQLSFEQINKMLLNHNYWTTEESWALLSKGNEINVNGFNEFLNNFKNSLNVKILALGDWGDEMTNNTILSVFSPLNYNTTPEENINNTTVNSVILWNKKNYFLRTVYPSTTNKNNAFTKCFYIGGINFKNAFLLKMLDAIMGNIFFRELRINQQFGYIAKGKTKSIFNNYFFCAYVQGSTAMPEKINEHASNWIDDTIKAKIEKWSNREFSDNKRKALDSMFANKYNWINIFDRCNTELMVEKQFHTNKEIEEYASRLTKKEFIEFYVKTFNSTQIEEHSNWSVTSYIYSAEGVDAMKEGDKMEGVNN